MASKEEQYLQSNGTYKTEKLDTSGVKYQDYVAPKVTNSTDADFGDYTAKYDDMKSQLSSYNSKELRRIKQQSEMQLTGLQQQLDTNRLKYETQYDQDARTAQENYDTQKQDIEKQTYNNFKYANQMGATRGLSSSAQQVAMDNSVQQNATSLFNQNARSRDKTLLDLNSKLQSLKADLDGQLANGQMQIGLNESNLIGQANQNYFSQMQGLDMSHLNGIEQLKSQRDQQNLALAQNESNYYNTRNQDLYKQQLAEMQYNNQLANDASKTGWGAGLTGAQNTDARSQQVLMQQMADASAMARQQASNASAMELAMLKRQWELEDKNASLNQSQIGKVVPNVYGVNDEDFNMAVNAFLADADKQSMSFEQAVEYANDRAYNMFGTKAPAELINRDKQKSTSKQIDKPYVQLPVSPSSPIINPIYNAMLNRINKSSSK